jgi:hypothetical protein
MEHGAASGERHVVFVIWLIPALFILFILSFLGDRESGRYKRIQLCE